MRTRTGTVSGPAEEPGLRVRPVGRQVEVVGAQALLVEQLHGEHPAHPERAEGTGATRQGHEVPDPRFEHEAERIEDSLHLAVACDSGSPPAAPPTRRGTVPRGGAPAPPGRTNPGASRWNRSRMRTAAAAALGRQRRVDLELGGREHGAEPELRCGAGQTREGQRLGLLGGEAGEPRWYPSTRRTPPPGPLRRRSARQRRTGPRCRGRWCAPTPRLLGEPARGHLAVGLEEQEELHQSARTHGEIVGRVPDTGCQ